MSMNGTYCENCDGRKCMACVVREVHDDCVDDCPLCCLLLGDDLSLIDPDVLDPDGELFNDGWRDNTLRFTLDDDGEWHLQAIVLVHDGLSSNIELTYKVAFTDGLHETLNAVLERAVADVKAAGE